MMEKNKYLALGVLGVFLSGCTGVLTKNQAALVGALTCGAAGAAAGGIITHNTGHELSEGQAIPTGACAGCSPNSLIEYWRKSRPA